MGAASRDTNRRLRILVVDDHPIVRERLTEVINSEPDLLVCGEAEDRWQALNAIDGSPPDLLLLDLSLKNSSGLDLIKDLRPRHPTLPILVLSMHEESLYAERVLRAGARCFISKQQATRDILAAIRTVLAGDIYLSQPMTTRLSNPLAGRPRARSGLSLESLTDRELRVFDLLGQGCSTRQIASQLRLSIRTVETYRARIKSKLHLNNNFGLLQHAIRWNQAGGL